MRHLRLLAILAAFVPVSAYASPVTINFDNLGSGVVVGAAYAGQGVTFNNVLTNGFGSLPGGSAPTGIYSVIDGAQPGQGNPMSATFSFAVSSVSLTGLDVGSAGFILTAYNALIGGAVVSSQQVFGVGLGVGNFQTLTVSGAGILRVEFSQITPDGFDGTAWDNFVFDGDARVPEPATLLLLGTGLAAVVVRRRLTSRT